MTQIRTAAILFAAAVNLLSPASARAQTNTSDFPNRPITIQVGLTAGGPTDAEFRLLARLVSKTLGQPVIVENKAGVAGTLAASSLALGGKPDGYTIAQAPVSVFRVPYMQAVAWDPLRDFTYIIGVSRYVMGIAVRADSEFKTWDDVVRYARANPGKVSYASTGVGGTLHLGMEDIALRSGLQFNHIPYRGAADSSRALLAGEVMLQADAISGFTQFVEAGKARVLMVWEPERFPGMPNVPTARELGLDIVYQGPYGLIGPKGMAPEIVAKLHDAFKQALNDPEHLKFLAQFNQTLWYRSPQAYAAYAREAWVEERKLLQNVNLIAK